MGQFNFSINTMSCNNIWEGEDNLSEIEQQEILKWMGLIEILDMAHME